MRSQALPSRAHNFFSWRGLKIWKLPIDLTHGTNYQIGLPHYRVLAYRFCVGRWAGVCVGRVCDREQRRADARACRQRPRVAWLHGQPRHREKIMLWSPRSSTPSRSRSLRFLSGLWFVRKLPSMLTAIPVVCVALGLACAAGCHRVVLVPESSPVRIAKATRTTVYCLVDGEWTLSANDVILSEGWYCVPPSFLEDEK